MCGRGQGTRLPRHCFQSGAAMGLSPLISCSPLTPLMLPLVPQVPFGVHMMFTRPVVQALRLWHAIEVSPSLPTPSGMHLVCFLNPTQCSAICLNP